MQTTREQAYRQELEVMREELRRHIGMERDDYDELFRELTTKDTVEIADELQLHRELGTLTVYDRERLRRIAGALRRIEKGNYGICVSCGREISEKRLEAIPDAALCLECKRRRERDRHRRLRSR